MGFSLYFHNLAAGDVVDADRDGIAEFLAAEGLRIDSASESLVDAAGEPLAFDGHRSDLSVDSLDQEEPVGARIDHATLTPAECTFIYRLCVAGRMVIINPQGDPMFIVTGTAHRPEDIPEPDDLAKVASPEELAAALGAAYGGFNNWLGKVLGPD